jgi:hypothetical protein
MKTFSTLALTVLLFTACKKNAPTPATSPVDFTEAAYTKPGSYDADGKPNNMTFEQVTTELRNYLHTSLPEKTDLRISNPELLSSKAIADIKITKKSSVSITFVFQGTSWSNAISFYTYPSNNPPASAKDIKQITHVFPNAGGYTTLKAGDKVSIGTFEAGTSIGFVLMKNAWDPATKSLNNNVVHFCSNDILNPETDPSLKKHAVLMNYETEGKVLIGFEDVDRTDPACDHDFNDVVVYATVTPAP